MVVVGAAMMGELVKGGMVVDTEVFFANTEANFREHFITLEAKARSCERSLYMIQRTHKGAIGERGVSESKLQKANLEAEATDAR